MYVVLTRDWNESFYACYEDAEKAKEAFKRNKHWYINTWLIEGDVIDASTYIKGNEDRLPY